MSLKTINYKIAALSIISLLSTGETAMAQNERPSRPDIAAYIDKFNVRDNPERIPFSSKMETFLTSFEKYSADFQESDRQVIKRHREIYHTQKLNIINSANQRAYTGCENTMKETANENAQQRAVALFRQRKELEKDIENEYAILHNSMLQELSVHGRELVISLLDTAAAAIIAAEVDWERLLLENPQEANFYISNPCGPRDVPQLEVRDIPVKSTGPVSGMRRGTVPIKDNGSN